MNVIVWVLHLSILIHLLFRHVGTPPVTLESINEVRQIAEQKRFIPYHSTGMQHQRFIRIRYALLESLGQNGPNLKLI